MFEIADYEKIKLENSPGRELENFAREHIMACYESEELFLQLTREALEQEKCVCSFDFEKGVLNFGKHSFDIQILALSDGRAWFWAWNERIKDVPKNMLADAEKVRNYGRSFDVPELTHSALRAENGWPTVLSVIGCGITKSDTISFCDRFNKNFEVVMLLKSPILRPTCSPSPDQIFKRYHYLRGNGYAVALRKYLLSRGYTLVKTTRNSLIYTNGAGQTFDLDKTHP